VATTSITVVALSSTAWAATNWVTRLASSSSGHAHANSLPVAPPGVAAACAAPTTAKTIKVSWTAVTHATSYSIYDATTSAGGTYTLVASGVSATSWTSAALTVNTNYWFEVVAIVGSNWSSAKSTTSAESTIKSANPFCVQP
jgi:cellulose 1,4-beta-cellobiosidase